MKPMRLVHKDEPSRQEIEMAKISQNWREWRGEGGAQWNPYDGPTSPWSDKVSAALERGRYVVVASAPIPLWRIILRKIFRIG